MVIFFISDKLNDRLDSILVTLGTNIMNRLAIYHTRLQAVSKRPGSELVQLVALLFSRPVFYGHQFFFQLVYTANCRRISRLRFK